jgi:hypothetical protein
LHAAPALASRRCGALAPALFRPMPPLPLHLPQAFEAASGLKVNTNLTDRRPGDAQAVWAATETAEKELGWKGKLTVKEMCEDQWRWASQNPDGFLTGKKE